MIKIHHIMLSYSNPINLISKCTYRVIRYVRLQVIKPLTTPQGDIEPVSIDKHENKYK